MSSSRDGSRLEVDDPAHCKNCGAKIAEGDFGYTLEDGRRVILQRDADEWEDIEVEECHECWAENQLKELRRECMVRYGGELAEVLDQ